MLELRDRLKILMSEYNLNTQQQLADFAEVSKGLVGQWFNGTTGLGAKPLMAFQKKTNFSSQWLLDGTGEKYRESPKYAEFAERLRQSIEASNIKLDKLAINSFIKKEKIEQYLLGHTLPYVEDAEHLANALNVETEWLRYGDAAHIPPIGSQIGVVEDRDLSETHIDIPIYDYRLSAGSGNSAWVERSDADDLISMRKKWFSAKGLNPESLRGMYVRGDSMEPVLMNWDTVILDTSDTEIVDGQIYAICYKNNLYIKQLRHGEDGIQIISLNPEYTTMQIAYGSDVPFQVLGRMVWRGG